MELEDFVEPEIGIAVGVTAALATPSIRRTLRKGAVYGLAGLMMAGDAALAITKSLGSSVKKGMNEVAQKSEEKLHENEASSVATKQTGEAS